MCGIAGFYQFKRPGKVDKCSLEALLQAMRYRGPDHLGMFSYRHLGIGNVRLAIQGIDTRGNQPLFDEDRRIVVVFNGEIYNYPQLRRELESQGFEFRTNTDTELFIHLYQRDGVRLADSLNGMFAFALYDLDDDRLLLGRDPTAQKPLFAHETEAGWVFASELKALLQEVEGPRVDPIAARTFLSMGYVLEPRTIVQGVFSVEPGSIVVLRTGKRPERHEFSTPTLNLPNIGSIDEWLEIADSLFRTSIKRTLLSDVPVTLFLSGGVDSSLVAVYLRELGSISQAYTGSFRDEPGHDEYKHVVKLGEYCGFRVQRSSLTKELMARHMDDFLDSSSQPQGDYSGIATYVLAQDTAREYRVVLGGDGGDELFGGYPTYKMPGLQGRFGFIPSRLIRYAQRLSAGIFDDEAYLSLSFQLQQLAQSWHYSNPKAHYYLKNFLPDSLAARLLATEIAEEGKRGDGEAVITKIYNEVEGDPVKKLTTVDFQTFLRSGTIPKVERNTMKHSLESRLPFLDNEIRELSQKTPSTLMLRGGKGKYCLRKLLQRKIGTAIRLNPRKQGFSPPLKSMLRNELRDWHKDTMAVLHPVFSLQAQRALEIGNRSGLDLHRLEWNVAVLSDWLLRNGVGL